MYQSIVGKKKKVASFYFIYFFVELTKISWKTPKNQTFFELVKRTKSSL